MEISVIIPSYKPGDYIWECLDSLFNQTLGKERYEVILILNGCDEPYRTQISKWVAQHDSLNFKYIHTDEKGVSIARNIGLDNASGIYICFIDDDDYVSPRYLESLYESASYSNIVIADVIGFEGSTGLEVPDFKPHTKFTELYSKNVDLDNGRIFFNVTYRKLIPSQIIGNRRFYRELSFGEDSVFMFLISDKIKEIVTSFPDAIYYRRFRPDSVYSRNCRYHQVTRKRLKMIRKYCRIYFNSPSSYKLSFFLTRILSSIKGILLST